MPSPAYTADRLARQDLRQLGRDPERGVVVLAEDDRAVLQPGLALDPVLGQEVLHRGQLGVARLGPRELRDDGAQVARLDRRQRVERILQPLGVFLVVQDFAAQHPLGRGLPEAKLEQMRCSSSDFMKPAALVRSAQRRGKLLGGLVRQVEGPVGQQAQPREALAGVGVRAHLRVGMDGHADALQQPLRLQRLAAAQHGVAHQRVLALEETRRQRLVDGRLGEGIEGAEPPVAEEAAVIDARAQAQRGEKGILAGRRQRAAQQFPCLAAVRGRLLALHVAAARVPSPTSG